MTRQLLLSAKVLLCFLLIHRKLAWSFFSSGISVFLQTKTQILQVSLPQRDPNRNVSSEEWRPERVKGVEGRQEVGAFLLRKSLQRFSVPSVSCEAASNWPRSWPASAGPSRASSARSRSWQWSSWRRKHWRCLGSEALQNETRERRNNAQSVKTNMADILLCWREMK